MSELLAQRVIEESVPGKQITLAHVIAAPIASVYQSLGIDAAGAIGILTLSPFESVETSLTEVLRVFKEVLHFSVVDVTRT